VHAAYLRPAKLEEALDALAERRLTVLAGGTDHYPARVGRETDEEVLDLTELVALRGIAREAGYWRIGATTTWSEVIAPLPGISATPPRPPTVCRRFSRSMRRWRSQVGAAGARCLLAKFITGPRKTVREPDELVTAVLVPASRGMRRAGLIKVAYLSLQGRAAAC
jgi:CO/xanthine dehydrogenase FAD-binding subunit